jgi:hypothetical protein
MLDNFKILKVKNISETSFTIDAIVEGERVSVEFKRSDLIEKPLAYDEPWVYSFESINSPDGNVYSINANYFGNPRTNLEFDEVDTDSLEQINKINENIFPMKKTIISPVGLKGNEINERMKQLMGIKPINENKSNIVIELTKMGPDGNAYAIIRENHEWYIKKTNKTKNLVAEDFKYIGGLQNKKQEAYPSYAKAIKHLNLKFRSLAEAYNYDGEINLFVNDNLLSEMTMAAGFSEMKGNGFSGEGNLEGNKPMDEEDYMDEVEMTEAEKAIDEMMTKEELKGGQKKLDVNKNGKLDAEDFKKLRAGKKGMEEEFQPHGSYTISNHGGYEVMLSPDGEMAKVRDAYGSDNPETSDWLEIEYVYNEETGELEPVIDPNGYNIPLNMVMRINEMTAKEKKFAALAEPKDKITYADKIAGAKKGEVKESKLSILGALKNMDAIIDSLTEGEVKKKV